MSSVPPNMPPGGGPPPPYDPKMQWRAYREQQKAAWRAQRDTWRAQRHAWKATYVGPYGPRVPSVVGPVLLVCIGVIALLVVTGHIAADSFSIWFGRWWPLILIAAGLGLLGEWALDMRRKTPVRRSGSFVGILFLVAFLGLCAAGWNHMRPWHRNWNGDNDFFNFWGMPEHDNDQQVLNTQVPANATIEIQNPRGDVSITAGDQPNMQVQAHEMAYADSDDRREKDLRQRGCARHGQRRRRAGAIERQRPWAGESDHNGAEVGQGLRECRPWRCDCFRAWHRNRRQRGPWRYAS